MSWAEWLQILADCATGVAKEWPVPGSITHYFLVKVTKLLLILIEKA